MRLFSGRLGFAHFGVRFGTIRRESRHDELGNSSCLALGVGGTSEPSFRILRETSSFVSESKWRQAFFSSFDPILKVFRFHQFFVFFPRAVRRFFQPFLSPFFSEGRELFLEVSSRDRLGGESDDFGAMFFFSKSPDWVAFRVGCRNVFFSVGSCVENLK